MRVRFPPSPRMEQEEIEQARSVIRAVDRALSAAKGLGPLPEGLTALLDAARRAVPKKLDPHPCSVRCWRVGGASDLDERGKCLECGSPGIGTDDHDFKKICTPEAVVSLCEALLASREVLEHPAVLAAAYSARVISAP